MVTAATSTPNQPPLSAYTLDFFELCKEDSHLEVEEYLEDPEFNPNVVDSAGFGGVHYACLEGGAEVLQMMMGDGRVALDRVGCTEGVNWGMGS